MSGKWARLDTLDGWTLDGQNVIHVSGAPATITMPGRGPNGPDQLVFYRSWVVGELQDGRWAVVYKQLLTEAQRPPRPVVDSPYKGGDSVWIKAQVDWVRLDGLLEVSPEGEFSSWDETYSVHPDDVRPVTDEEQD